MTPRARTRPSVSADRLRARSPDHTLVLLNVWCGHQTGMVNTFAYSTREGSSGVGLNTIPSSAIDRIEVLPDESAAQKGYYAIAAW